METVGWDSTAYAYLTTGTNCETDCVSREITFDHLYYRNSIDNKNSYFVPRILYLKFSSHRQTKNFRWLIV